MYRFRCIAKAGEKCRYFDRGGGCVVSSGASRHMTRNTRKQRHLLTSPKKEGDGNQGKTNKDRPKPPRNSPRKKQLQYLPKSPPNLPHNTKKGTHPNTPPKRSELHPHEPPKKKKHPLTPTTKPLPPAPPTSQHPPPHAPETTCHVPRYHGGCCTIGSRQESRGRGHGGGGRGGGS